MATSVGDEGGFAPNLETDEEAIELIIQAVCDAGYNTENTKIAIDAAASEWFNDGVYHLPKRKSVLKTSDLINYLKTLRQISDIFNRRPSFGIRLGGLERNHGSHR